MVAVRRGLVFLGPDDLKAILVHQTGQRIGALLSAPILQFLGPSGTAIALQAQAALFADMSQDHHIITLTAAHRVQLPRTKATRCEMHNEAQELNRPLLLSRHRYRRTSPAAR